MGRHAIYLLVVGIGACGEPGIGPARMPDGLREDGARLAARAPRSGSPDGTSPAPPPLPRAVRVAPPGTPAGTVQDGAADPDADARLCEEAAKIAPLGMDLERYDPRDYVATCRGHLASDRGPAWREFYGCLVEVGDDSWLRRCIKKSPGRGSGAGG